MANGFQEGYDPNPNEAIDWNAVPRNDDGLPTREWAAEHQDLVTGTFEETEHPDREVPHLVYYDALEDLRRQSAEIGDGWAYDAPTDTYHREKDGPYLLTDEEKGTFIPRDQA